MKRKIEILLVLFLSINISSTNYCQEIVDDRTTILMKGYYEFELGFKRKHKGENKEKHLMNSKILLKKAIENYPDGWENIIERVYLATIEYELGNEEKAREHFEMIYNSPFSYDLKSIYGDNEMGLTWYLIRKLYINPNNCEEFKETNRMFRFQDYEKFYEYKNDMYEYWKNNPGLSNCGGGPYKYEEVLRDLIICHYCNGNQERAIDLIKKSSKKYLNLEGEELPEEIDIYVRLIKNKYTEDEIEEELHKSISTLKFEKSYWSIFIFGNKIGYSNKIKKGDKIIELSKEFEEEGYLLAESRRRMSEILNQTELYKRLKRE